MRDFQFALHERLFRIGLRTRRSVHFSFSGVAKASSDRVVRNVRHILEGAKNAFQSCLSLETRLGNFARAPAQIRSQRGLIGQCTDRASKREAVLRRHHEAALRYYFADLCSSAARGDHGPPTR
jgi:hypothetical protein